MPAPLKTFIIYARADEDYKKELLQHLRSTLITSGDLEVWSDDQIRPGEDWDKSIKTNLENSQLVLVLVSADSLASPYINSGELRQAIAQRAEGRTVVVPVCIRRCGWNYNAVIRGLQGLPKDMRPVSSYPDHDDAWTEVIDGLKAIIDGFRHRRDDARKAVESPQLSDDASKMPTQVPQTPPKNPAQAKPRATNPSPAARPRYIEPNMADIAAGTFKMGNDEYSDEKPVHSVNIRTFQLAKTAVTFEEYDLFCEATERDKPGDNGWGRDRRPVINVSWNDAKAYCAWLSEMTGKKYRLPTESEWEYAARGGNLSKGYEHAGGNDIDAVAWYDGNSGNKTRPVGGKNANELGLYDMSGNVWEWCEDWYHDTYDGAPDDGNAWLSQAGSYRVLRGGSWVGKPAGARVTGRGSWIRTKRGGDVGFRLARTL